MPFLTSRLALASAVLAPCAATPLLAQTGEGENILVIGQQGGALNVPNTTGSRLGLTPLETPATISLIDGDAVRARGDLSIVEAETRAPGITSVANPGNGGTALAARGFSGQGSVLQLVDGIRLFPVAGTITFPTDPWMVERIDVLNGPASVLYGQGSLGGAVNVISRKPNATRTDAEGEIGYGSQNTFHAAAGLGGPISDQLSYRMDASYRRSDFYVDRGGSHSLALSGTLRWAPSDTLAVTLRDDYGDQNPAKYFGTPLIDGRIDKATIQRNYNVADADIHYRDNRTTLNAEWAPTARISISNTAYYLTSKRLFKDLESYCAVSAHGECPNGYNAGSSLYDPATPGTIYRTDNLGIVHDQKQLGDQASAKLTFPLAEGIDNSVVAGVEANQIRLTYSNDFGSDLQEDTVNPYQFNPGVFYDTQGIAPRYRTRTDEVAVFAEDRVKMGKLSIVSGIRYEHDRVQRWTINSSTSETYVLDKSLNNTTWRVGGVYQPLPTVSLYAQYATGVDPLGTLTTYSTGQVSYSNATGHQVEVGAKGSFLNGHGTATLAAYRIVKNNLLAQQTLTSPVQQVGQRSAQGIEASVSLDLARGFGVEANGTVLRAKFDNFITGSISYTGKTPPNIPQTSANLWLRWDVMRQVQARAGLRYVGHTYSDNANAFRIPGYAVVDTTLSYALTKQVALDLHIYNLLDKLYATTTYNDEQWILGRPRSVDVSLRARF
jgi:iron complex outermembrane receptor protein